MQLIIKQIDSLSAKIDLLSVSVSDLRLDQAEIKRDVEQLRHAILPKEKGFKFWSLLVTTVGGIVGGLIAVIQTMAPRQ